MKTMQGKIVSILDRSSAVVEVMSTKMHPKYKKMMSKSNKFVVDVAKGMEVSKNDEVVVGEVRPISKRKKFRVQSKVEVK
jgi:small subunit ribosomal protein S17